MKYIVDETVALAIRDYIRSYLQLDEYGATLPNLSYPIHSLYLDSADLKLYQATINGDKNRFKLRLRYYENRPDAPIYFEIKRRMNNNVAKQRAGVRREAVSSLLAGQLPRPGHLISDDPKHLVAVQRFCQLMDELQARPRTHVAYLREAWLSLDDNSVRVTMDRQTRTETDPGAKLVADMLRPASVFGEKVVLELKFTVRFPDWFKEMVRVFGLTQCSAAKYADGVTRLGTHTVSRAFSLEVRERAQRRLEHFGNGGLAFRGEGGTDGLEAGFAPEFS
jgi:hypothetical protein